MLRHISIVGGSIISDLVESPQYLAEAACHCPDYRVCATFDHIGPEAATPGRDLQYLARRSRPFG
jgi:hypothetical protein